MKISLKAKILMFPVVFFLILLTVGLFTVTAVQDKVGGLDTHGPQLVKEITSKIILSGIVGLLIVSSLSVFLLVSIDRPIHGVIEGLAEGVRQVSAASGEISQASQHVAQGTSDQASGIEEVSSSLEEIASITKQNSDNAQQAKVVMNEASEIIKKVQYHMGQMGQAISEITSLSVETGKIIKTIDEIAFQTNLLALNAAVEAARAGEAGAGFSVVANEVRNLAMKASEAAKNTGRLLENTMKAVKKGNELTQSTQDAFKENIEVAVKHTKLIEEIAVASQEQAQGIQQVTDAMAQMNHVTQVNAASAEESASASQELNAQVEQVNGIILELFAIVGDSNGALRAPRSSKPVVEKLRRAAASHLNLAPKSDQARAIASLSIMKNDNVEKTRTGKRPAQRGTEPAIHLHDGALKEKDDEVLKEF